MKPNNRHIAKFIMDLGSVDSYVKEVLEDRLDTQIEEEIADYQANYFWQNEGD